MKKIWNLPNQLTIARFFMTIVFFLLLHYGHYGIAFMTFVLTGLTDFLDGYAARRSNLTTDFGRLADPITDKILSVGGFVMLQDICPMIIRPWMTVILVAREFLASGIRSYAEAHGVAFAADYWGKSKMVLQILSIGGVVLYMWRLRSDGFVLLVTVITYGAVIATFISGLRYFWRGYRVLEDISSA